MGMPDGPSPFFHSQLKAMKYKEQKNKETHESKDNEAEKTLKTTMEDDKSGLK